MKIRKGFVSNSSTTSFCIMGKYFNVDHELIQEHPDRTELETKYNYSGYTEPGGWYSATGRYIGLSINEMKDNETKEEFRERVRQDFKDILGIDIEPQIIISGWREG